MPRRKSCWDSRRTASTPRSRSARIGLHGLGATAVLAVVLWTAGTASSQTLFCETTLLHEGQLLPSSATSLTSQSETMRVERPIVGGLAPGRSTGGRTGLQLEGGVIAVPEPGPRLQGAMAVLALLALRSRRVRNGARA